MLRIIGLLTMFVVATQSISPIIPLPTNPGIYFEYAGRMQLASKWSRYLLHLNYYRLDHNTTELNNCINEIISKCPGRLPDCQRYFTFETNVARYLHTADHLLEKFERLTPEIDPTPIQQSPTFNPSNNITAEETTKIVYLEVGAEEESIHKERERFRSTQVAALQYFREHPPTSPEQFFITIKEWFNTLESMLKNHLKNYKKVIQIIQQAEAGKIHQALLSAEEIKRIMEDLTEQNFNEMIPELDTFSTEFRKLVPITVSRHRYIINIEIVFPLFSKEEYLLFKAYPVMTSQGKENGAFIVPESPYIASGPDNTTHCLMSELEIIGCVRHTNTRYCRNPTLMRTSSSCMSGMLHQPTMNTLKTCNVGNKRFKIQWTYLTHSREWLISTPRPIEIKLSCSNNKTYTIAVQGAIIIEAIGTCKFQTNETMDNSYFLRTVKPNRPTYHYMPLITLKTEKSPTEGQGETTIVPKLASVERRRNSDIPDEWMEQIHQLRVTCYGHLVYSTLLTLLIIVSILFKLYRCHEPDNADEPLLTTKESTPKTSNTNTPDSPVPIIPPPMPIITHKRVDFNLSPARIRQRNPTHLESIV